MKLTWHIVAKDLRRLRWPLLIWVGMLLLKLVILRGFFSLENADDRAFGGWQSVFFALCTLEGVVNFFLVVALVLDDAPTDGAGFWSTRPISGGRLLGAKLISALLMFAMLPVLVAAGWWAYCGLRGVDLRGALQGVLLIQFLISVPAFVLAALCGSARRVLIWTAALALAALFFFIISVARNRGEVIFDGPSFDLAMVSLLLAALGAVFVLYRQRRLEVALTLVVGGLGLACLFARFGPMGIPYQERLLLSPLEEAAPIRAELREAALYQEPERPRLKLDFQLHEIPPGLAIVNGLVEAEFRWPDGTVMRRTAMAVKFFSLPVQAALHAKGIDPDPQFDRAVPSQRRDEPGQSSLRFSLGLTAAESKRFANQPPAASLRLVLAAGHPSLLVELPAKSGAGARGEGGRFRVLGADKIEKNSPLGERCSVFLGAARGRGLFEIKPQAIARPYGYQPGGPEFYRTTMPALGTILERHRAWMYRSRPASKGQPEVSTEWLETASIGVVGVREEGMFERAVEIRSLAFRFNEKTSSPAPAP